LERSPSFAARCSYTEALKNVGDEDTLKALEELATRSLADRAAQDVMVARRSHAQIEQRLKKLRDDLRRES
jgi:hypothetical protein